MTRLLLALALLAAAAPATVRADHRALALDAPAPAGSSDASHFGLDLDAAALLPIATGGTMTLEMPYGFQLSVSGGVTASFLVDAINDVGAALTLWDDRTANEIRAVLSDAIVLEGAVGLRPGLGPLELLVGYVLFWSDGSPPPSLQGLGVSSVEISAYAIHGQLGLRIPIGDVLVVRLGLGWLHTLAQSVSVGMEDDASIEASPLEAIVSDWISRYGFGPTLRLSVGLHFG